MHPVWGAMRTVSAQSWQVVMVLLDLGFGIVSWIVFLLACTIHAVATIFIVRYPQILEQKTGTHRNWRHQRLTEGRQATTDASRSGGGLRAYPPFWGTDPVKRERNSSNKFTDTDDLL